MLNRRKGQAKRYNARLTGVWLAILLLFVSEFFFYTWCRVQCRHLQYDIRAENDTAAHLAGEKKDLKIEIARLGSPDRIMKIARQRGLVMPTTDQLVVLP